jgi:hypothetical protein
MTAAASAERVATADEAAADPPSTPLGPETLGAPTDQAEFAAADATIETMLAEARVELAQRTVETAFRPASDAEEALAWLRAGKVATHEILHTMGVKHCAFFRCRINGSGTMRATDQSPIDLCPVCLRKLQYATGCDPVKLSVGGSFVLGYR